MMSQKNLVWEAFKYWLPLAAVTVILAGLVCVAVQQDYRMSANDPQIQIAEDYAGALSHGQAEPESLVPPNPTVDIGSSLSPFLVVYNATGTPIGSSVALDGKMPSLPGGVLDYVKQHGEERLTWQPKAGLRFAAVITSYSGPASGFLLVGRSLKEVEKRESQLTMMTLLATVLALVVSYAIFWWLMKMKRDNSGMGQNMATITSEKIEINIQ